MKPLGSFFRNLLVRFLIDRGTLSETGEFIFWSMWIRGFVYWNLCFFQNLWVRFKKKLRIRFLIHGGSFLKPMGLLFEICGFVFEIYDFFNIGIFFKKPVGSFYKPVDSLFETSKFAFWNLCVFYTWWFVIWNLGVRFWNLLICFLKPVSSFLLKPLCSFLGNLWFRFWNL